MDDLEGVIDRALGVWYCARCTWTMQESERSAHLDSKGHAQRLQHSMLSPPRTQAGSPLDSSEVKPRDTTKSQRPESGQWWWTCRDCHKLLATSKKNDHTCDRQRPTPKLHKTEKWACDECGLDMDALDRERHPRKDSHAENAAKVVLPHPNGQRHIKIKDFSRVYKNLNPIPVRFYKRAGAYKKPWRGAGSFVTAGDIEKASMQFDGEGSRRMDTQWGVFPSGGAFRNEYF
ncbi:hypothetical protein BO71DRAFT_426647 [Aspergillus ellipticus CBS 707.79]|uniref:Uncharacterized protein n=1 Tax=Aspergillus ellipticus CBS 707.79 TaxID=1448320 RepID=A0A319DK73_9EURO|nr:hypothetical protein BO71DRAFT_426647 [Aspergillus ellipticus CBS 707.79]